MVGSPDALTLPSLIAKADLVAEDAVGLVVAKAVTDSRTANKAIAILANAVNQNDTIATWKELSGQTPGRKDVSAEEMQQKIDDAEDVAALVPTLINTIWVDVCFQQLHSAAQEDVWFASELYPDLEFQIVQEYMQQLL
ncbi:hypothetical protein WJX82_003426 [Trebouxia sp. C0006]